MRGLEPSSPPLPSYPGGNQTVLLPNLGGLGSEEPHNGNTSLWLGDLTKLVLNPAAGTCELHGLGQDLGLCVSFLLKTGDHYVYLIGGNI